MKTDAQFAKELLEVIDQRKRLDKRETELKDLFRVKMNNMGLDTLSLGGVLVSLVLKSRASLDKKALVVVYGKETISKYEKTTEYVQVDVKAQDAAIKKEAA